MFYLFNAMCLSKLPLEGGPSDHLDGHSRSNQNRVLRQLCHKILSMNILRETRNESRHNSNQTDRKEK